MRAYSTSPEIPIWESSPHVTLLGDAVHLMSPSGGIDAVAALNDAVSLTQIIVENNGDIDVVSVERFERVMRKFASACLRRSFLAGEKMLNAPSAKSCSSEEL